MRQWCCKRQHGSCVAHTVSCCCHFLKWPLMQLHTHSQHMQAHLSLICRVLKLQLLCSPFYNFFSVSSALCGKTKTNFRAVVLIQQPWRIYASAPTLSLLHICLPCHFATAFNRLCFPGGIALFPTPFTQNGSWMMVHFGSFELFKYVVLLYLIMTDRWELQNLNDRCFF